ncbi:MAG: type IX secretion system sortase PorU, partial [Saprospiraceae bacterium]
MKNFTSLLLLLLPFVAYSQVRLQKTLQWEDEPWVYTSPQTGEELEIWQFTDASFLTKTPTLPVVSERISVPNGAILSVRLVKGDFVSFAKSASADDDKLTEQITFQTEVARARNQSYGYISFVPIIKKGSQYERLESYELEVTWTINLQTLAKGGGGENTRNSVLETGTIYKIAVEETGIHQITYDFLTTSLEINLANVEPRNIQIFGNGGGMLPERNSVERYDDLVENAIQIVGEDDGSFNESDYILFYGESPDKWTYQENNNRFKRSEHFYDTKNYYFIKIGNTPGKRVAAQSSLNSTAYTTNEFDDYAFYEVEEVNLMDPANGTQGTGKTWFSDYFKNIKERSYEFEFPNRIVADPVKITAQMAGRSSSGNLTYFAVDLPGSERLVSSQMNGTNLASSAERRYASLGSMVKETTSSNENIDLTLSYPVSQSGTASSVAAEGWVNYIEVNARRRLTMVGNQLLFRDLQSINQPNTTFQLNGSNVTIWDISNPLDPRSQEINTSGNQISFGVNTDTTNQSPIREFIAFNGNFLAPEAVGNIPNQNIHGIDNIDFVIIYHADFVDAANQLAEHRRSHSGMDIALVEVSEVYNEFSSGKQDPAAIRDFAKMLVERNDKFKYLLLFGDGSFDYKSIKGGGNSNFVPAYETDESLHPIDGYPSDDFYGLLSDDEGTPTLRGALDIGIGRLPIKTAAEASNVVNKIIHYDTNPKTLGDWRLRMVWVADDEDNNRHLNDTESIAYMSDTLYPFFNQEKVYLDAFQQVSSAGGEGYPDVTDALNTNIFKGMLAMNYLGHGGSGGWTQERVLDSDRGDIRNWSNYDQLPLFITATCSFSGYDDRNQVTAGEQVLLNPRGGGIGLLTTVRSVFASQNARLVTGVMQHLFKKIDGKVPPMGDVTRIAKNSVSSTGENNRRFTFLGDPSMKLALPEHNVVTTRVDEISVTNSSVDTLRALQKITIAGEVHDSDGRLLEDFNGILFPTLYDKSVTFQTLGNDDSSPIRDFDLQKNVIFKGRASITDGRWKFTFVVPRDINYEFGLGKISYYAHDGVSEDASGNYENVVIGGTDENALADDQGPQVEVYMDNESFVFGGVTSPDPLLLVKLADDNGINVAGNSIGHDLEGTLDNNTQNAIRLNDFYEAALDDYTKGEVRYQLSDLEDGLHTIKVRAWDVANNPAEGYTEFVVASDAEVALKNVLNYPNPFVQNTCFQFDHSLRGQEMEVLVQIFTVGGRLVKTLESNIINDGAVRQGDCIPWDGLDDFGDKLGRGVYLYKIKVRAANSEIG